METATKRELNQQTAAVLARVTDHDDLIVTERGTARWRVSAYGDEADLLARLEREGIFTPAVAAPEPWPTASTGRPYSDAEVDALVADAKGEH